MFPLPKGAVHWYSLIFLVLFFIKEITSEGRVVCYYTNWSVYRPGTAKFNPQNINPYLCTHLIYAFGGFTKDNTLKPFDKYQDIEQGGYTKFTGLKAYNKNLKTLLAIGGWNEGSSRFSPLVANPERRQQFIKNVLKFLRQNHFDGLDLDWEYPAFRDGGKPRDRDNYAQFVQELRSEFDRESSKTGRPRLLLTMAVPAGIEYIEKGYDVEKLNKYLDWFNILSYDYHSAYEPSVNHHSPLYSLEEESEYNYDTELNIDYSIKFYLNAGADRDKLVLGIPTYGRSYTLVNEELTELGAPADGPGDQGDATREKGYLAYYEICQNLRDDPDWTVIQPNPKAMGPYTFRGNQWIGYDDEAMVRKKAEYVAENGLGGIMFWSIDNDDFRGSCGGKPYPLIEAAKEALFDRLGVSDNEVARPNRPKKPSRSRSRQGSSHRNVIGDSSTYKSIDSVKKHSSRQGSSKKRLRSTTKTTTTTTTTTPSSLYIGGRSTTPAPPTTPDPGTDFKCEEEGFFPHPRDCKKYFWCLDSGPSNLGIVAHQFTCPSGLFFNTAADSCDFARNVPCKTKSTTTTAKPTTQTASTTTTTTTTTQSPRITAATSRASFLRYTSTTTEAAASSEEEEYEDESDNSGIDEEEDPRVIKELIQLIKKVGGLEELEKQLHFQEDGSMVLKNVKTEEVSTTPSTISKSLYHKVLSRPNNLNAFRNSLYKPVVRSTASSSINSEEEDSQSVEIESSKKSDSKYSSVIRNSRPGPQNDGIDKLPEFEGFLKERPKYVTITRTRPTAAIAEISKEEEEEDAEDDDISSEINTDSSRDSKNRQILISSTQSTPTATPSYVSIRRSRPTTVNYDNQESIEEEKIVSSTARSAYQSLNRRRSTTAIPLVEETSTASPQISTTTRYKFIERSRPTTPQTEEQKSTTFLRREGHNVEDDSNSKSSSVTVQFLELNDYTTLSPTQQQQQQITSTRIYENTSRIRTTTVSTGLPSTVTEISTEPTTIKTRDLTKTTTTTPTNVPLTISLNSEKHYQEDPSIQSLPPEKSPIQNDILPIIATERLTPITSAVSGLDTDGTDSPTTPTPTTTSTINKTDKKTDIDHLKTDDEVTLTDDDSNKKVKVSSTSSANGSGSVNSFGSSPTLLSLNLTESESSPKDITNPSLSKVEQKSTDVTTTETITTTTDKITTAATVRKTVASRRSTITSSTTTTQKPKIEITTNKEFLGTVSSPRPFGFPRRRTRPTSAIASHKSTTTTANTIINNNNNNNKNHESITSTSIDKTPPSQSTQKVSPLKKTFNPTSSSKIYVSRKFVEKDNNVNRNDDDDNDNEDIDIVDSDDNNKSFSNNNAVIGEIGEYSSKEKVFDQRKFLKSSNVDVNNDRSSSPKKRPFINSVRSSNTNVDDNNNDIDFDNIISHHLKRSYSWRSPVNRSFRPWKSTTTEAPSLDSIPIIERPYRPKTKNDDTDDTNNSNNRDDVTYYSRDSQINMQLSNEETVLNREHQRNFDTANNSNRRRPIRFNNKINNNRRRIDVDHSNAEEQNQNSTTYTRTQNLTVRNRITENRIRPQNLTPNINRQLENKLNETSGEIFASNHSSKEIAINESNDTITLNGSVNESISGSVEESHGGNKENVTSLEVGKEVTNVSISDLDNEDLSTSSVTYFGSDSLSRNQKINNESENLNKTENGTVQINRNENSDEHVEAVGKGNITKEIHPSEDYNPQINNENQFRTNQSADELSSGLIPSDTVRGKAKFTINNSNSENNSSSNPLLPSYTKTNANNESNVNAINNTIINETTSFAYEIHSNENSKISENEFLNDSVNADSVPKIQANRSDNNYIEDSRKIIRTRISSDVNNANNHNTTRHFRKQLVRKRIYVDKSNQSTEDLPRNNEEISTNGRASAETNENSTSNLARNNFEKDNIRSHRTRNRLGASAENILRTESQSKVANSQGSRRRTIINPNVERNNLLISQTDNSEESGSSVDEQIPHRNRQENRRRLYTSRNNSAVETKEFGGSIEKVENNENRFYIRRRGGSSVHREQPERRHRPHLDNDLSSLTAADIAKWQFIDRTQMSGGVGTVVRRRRPLNRTSTDSPDVNNTRETVTTRTRPTLATTTSDSEVRRFRTRPTLNPISREQNLEEKSLVKTRTKTVAAEERRSSSNEQLYDVNRSIKTGEQNKNHSIIENGTLTTENVPITKLNISQSDSFEAEHKNEILLFEESQDGLRSTTTTKLPDNLSATTLRYSTMETITPESTYTTINSEEISEMYSTFDTTTDSIKLTEYTTITPKQTSKIVDDITLTTPINLSNNKDIGTTVTSDTPFTLQDTISTTSKILSTATTDRISTTPETLFTTPETIFTTPDTIFTTVETTFLTTPDTISTTVETAPTTNLDTNVTDSTTFSTIVSDTIPSEIISTTSETPSTTPEEIPTTLETFLTTPDSLKTSETPSTASKIPSTTPETPSTTPETIPTTSIPISMLTSTISTISETTERGRSSEKSPTTKSSTEEYSTTQDSFWSFLDNSSTLRTRVAQDSSTEIPVSTTNNRIESFIESEGDFSTTMGTINHFTTTENALEDEKSKVRSGFSTLSLTKSSKDSIEPVETQPRDKNQVLRGRRKFNKESNYLQSTNEKDNSFASIEEINSSEKDIKEKNLNSFDSNEVGILYHRKKHWERIDKSLIESQTDSPIIYIGKVQNGYRPRQRTGKLTPLEIKRIQQIFNVNLSGNQIGQGEGIVRQEDKTDIRNVKSEKKSDLQIEKSPTNIVHSSTTEKNTDDETKTTTELSDSFLDETTTLEPETTTNFLLKHQFFRDKAKTITTPSTKTESTLGEVDYTTTSDIPLEATTASPLNSNEIITESSFNNINLNPIETSTQSAEILQFFRLGPKDRTTMTTLLNLQNQDFHTSTLPTTTDFSEFPTKSKQFFRVKSTEPPKTTRQSTTNLPSLSTTESSTVENELTTVENSLDTSTDVPSNEQLDMTTFLDLENFPSTTINNSEDSLISVTNRNLFFSNQSQFPDGLSKNRVTVDVTKKGKVKLTSSRSTAFNQRISARRTKTTLTRDEIATANNLDSLEENANNNSRLGVVDVKNPLTSRKPVSSALDSVSSSQGINSYRGYTRYRPNYTSGDSNLESSNLRISKFSRQNNENTKLNESSEATEAVASIASISSDSTESEANVFEKNRTTIRSTLIFLKGPRPDGRYAEEYNEKHIDVSKFSNSHPNTDREESLEVQDRKRHTADSTTEENQTDDQEISETDEIHLNNGEEVSTIRSTLIFLKGPKPFSSSEDTTNFDIEDSTKLDSEEELNNSDRQSYTSSNKIRSTTVSEFEDEPEYTSTVPKSPTIKPTKEKPNKESSSLSFEPIESSTISDNFSKTTKLYSSINRRKFVNRKDNEDSSSSSELTTDENNSSPITENNDGTERNYATINRKKIVNRIQEEKPSSDDEEILINLNSEEPSTTENNESTTKRSYSLLNRRKFVSRNESENNESDSTINNTSSKDSGTLDSSISIESNDATTKRTYSILNRKKITNIPQDEDHQVTSTEDGIHDLSTENDDGLDLEKDNENKEINQKINTTQETKQNQSVKETNSADDDDVLTQIEETTTKRSFPGINRRNFTIQDRIPVQILNRNENSDETEDVKESVSTTTRRTLTSLLNRRRFPTKASTIKINNQNGSDKEQEKSEDTSEKITTNTNLLNRRKFTGSRFSPTKRVNSSSEEGQSLKNQASTNNRTTNNPQGFKRRPFPTRSRPIFTTKSSAQIGEEESSSSIEIGNEQKTDKIIETSTRVNYLLNRRRFGTTKTSISKQNQESSETPTEETTSETIITSTGTVGVRRPFIPPNRRKFNTQSRISRTNGENDSLAQGTEEEIESISEDAENETLNIDDKELITETEERLTLLKNELDSTTIHSIEEEEETTLELDDESISTLPPNLLNNNDTETVVQETFETKEKDKTEKKISDDTELQGNETTTEIANLVDNDRNSTILNEDTMTAVNPSQTTETIPLSTSIKDISSQEENLIEIEKGGILREIIISTTGASSISQDSGEENKNVNINLKNQTSIDDVTDDSISRQFESPTEEPSNSQENEEDITVDLKNQTSNDDITEDSITRRFESPKRFRPSTQSTPTKFASTEENTRNYLFERKSFTPNFSKPRPTLRRFSLNPTAKTTSPVTESSKEELDQDSESASVEKNKQQNPLLTRTRFRPSFNRNINKKKDENINKTEDEKTETIENDENGSFKNMSTEDNNSETVNSEENDNDDLGDEDNQANKSEEISEEDNTADNKDTKIDSKVSSLLTRPRKLNFPTRKSPQTSPQFNNQITLNHSESTNSINPHLTEIINVNNNENGTNWENEKNTNIVNLNTTTTSNRNSSQITNSLIFNRRFQNNSTGNYALRNRLQINNNNNNNNNNNTVGNTTATVTEQDIESTTRTINGRRVRVFKVRKPGSRSNFGLNNQTNDDANELDRTSLTKTDEKRPIIRKFIRKRPLATTNNIQDQTQLKEDSSSSAEGSAGVVREAQGEAKLNGTRKFKKILRRVRPTPLAKNNTAETEEVTSVKTKGVFRPIPILGGKTRLLKVGERKETISSRTSSAETKEDEQQEPKEEVNEIENKKETETVEALKKDTTSISLKINKTLEELSEETTESDNEISTLSTVKESLDENNKVIDSSTPEALQNENENDLTTILPEIEDAESTTDNNTTPATTTTTKNKLFVSRRPYRPTKPSISAITSTETTVSTARSYVRKYSSNFNLPKPPSEISLTTGTEEKAEVFIRPALTFRRNKTLLKNKFNPDGLQNENEEEEEQEEEIEENEVFDDEDANRNEEDDVEKEVEIEENVQEKKEEKEPEEKEEKGEKETLNKKDDKYSQNVEQDKIISSIIRPNLFVPKSKILTNIPPAAPSTNNDDVNESVSIEEDEPEDIEEEPVKQEKKEFIPLPYLNNKNFARPNTKAPGIPNLIIRLNNGFDSQSEKSELEVVPTSSEDSSDTSASYEDTEEEEDGNENEDIPEDGKEIDHAERPPQIFNNLYKPTTKAPLPLPQLNNVNNNNNNNIVNKKPNFPGNVPKRPSSILSKPRVINRPTFTTVHPASLKLGGISGLSITTPTAFKLTNTRTYERKYSPTALPTESTPQQDNSLLEDLNIGALNARNKKIFEKTSRKHTTTKPKYQSSSTTTQQNDDANNNPTTILTTTNEILNNFDPLQENVLENVIAPPTTTKSPPSLTTTTAKMTTLYHIFALSEEDDSTTENYDNDDDITSSKREKLVEINRIVEVYSKEDKLKSKGGNMEKIESSKLKIEQNATLEHLGVIGRVTLVKLVDDGTSTKRKSPLEDGRELVIEGRSTVADYTPTEPTTTTNKEFLPVRNSIPIFETLETQEQRKSAKKLKLPEVILGVETSTIPLEGLFEPPRRSKDIQHLIEPVYASSLGEGYSMNPKVLVSESLITTAAPTVRSTPGEPVRTPFPVFFQTQTPPTTTTVETTITPTKTTPTTRTTPTPSPTSTTEALTEFPITPPETTTIGQSTSERSTNYVRPLVPLLRPESNESSPLVISIANLDKVILSKVPPKADSSVASSGLVSTIVEAPKYINLLHGAPLDSTINNNNTNNNNDDNINNYSDNNSNNNSPSNSSSQSSQSETVVQTQTSFSSEIKVVKKKLPRRAKSSTRRLRRTKNNNFDRTTSMSPTITTTS